MSAAKTLLFQKINECITQNQYFFLKIHGFVIWYSNSLDEMPTPFLILNRGVEFWASKNRIFKCLQRNRHFCRKLTNVSRKITTFPWKHRFSSLRPYGQWFDPRLLSTKRPFHFWSSIGCRTLSLQKQNFRMYAAKSSLFQKISECIMQNHYFSFKFHRFSSLRPYRVSRCELCRL